MRWGVTKKNKKQEDVVLVKKLSGGKTLTVTKDPTPPIARLLSKTFPAYKEHVNKFSNFTLKDGTGSKIGEATFYKDSPESLNLMWVGVKSKHRGNGYASSVLEGVVKFAKEQNLKKLTLEVPGNAPDALHIYEKLGFKKTNVMSVDDDIWGGLTRMELKL